MNTVKYTIASALLLMSAIVTGKPLSIATWNMEHLAVENDKGCMPRVSKDYLKLKKYAETVDADIFALQEIQNVDALKRVFDTNKYTLIISDRPETKPYDCKVWDEKLKKKVKTGKKSTTQNVAWAVKKDIKYKYSASDNIRELDLNTYLRYGLVLQLPEHELTLVNLHLKSSCYDGNLPSYDAGCTVKQIQLERLKKWVDQQGDQKIVLLGDWNTKIWSMNDYTTKQFPSFKVNTLSLKSCNPDYLKNGKAQPGVDNIFTNFTDKQANLYNFGKANKEGVEQNREAMLSDHCAIKLDL
ncbi:TPA: hypothetical protein I7286_08745 [Vibrio parahaemolyticus]|nr:hypothetical protein [Vibrio parahaemolyticus]